MVFFLSCGYVAGAQSDRLKHPDKKQVHSHAPKKKNIKQKHVASGSEKRKAAIKRTLKEKNFHLPDTTKRK